MKNQLHKTLLIFLQFCFCIHAYAVRYHVQNVFYGKGVSQFTAITQDKKGLIWLGTDRGLFYFDGYQIHSALTDRYIFSLMSIDGNRLCYTDYAGIHLYDITTERIMPLATEKHDMGNVRDALSLNRTVWAASESGKLICYDIRTDRMHIYDIHCGHCYTIAYADGTIYVGGSEGLGAFDIKRKRYEKIPFCATPKMVNSLLWDSRRKCLWIGTITDKLYRYANGHSEAVATKDISFKCLTFDIDHNLLAGTDNGLMEYNPEKKSIVWRQHDERDPQSICNNIIWSIFLDRTNNVWMGTDHGMSSLIYTPYYEQIPLYTMTDLSIGNRITCMLHSSDGCYWFGGANGIIRQSRSGKTTWYRVEDTRHTITHNRVRKIYEDKTHHVWICTDGGILHFDNASQRFISHKIKDRTGTYNTEWSYDIVEDDYGRLWIAAYSGGLFVVDKEKLLNWKSPKAYTGTIAANLLKGDNRFLRERGTHLIEDKHGALWVSCSNNITRIDTENMNAKLVCVRDTKGNVIDSYIDNMIISDNGMLWYVAGDKLVSINTANMKARVPKLDFMKDDRVQSMTYRDGMIWMTLTDRIMTLDTRSQKSSELKLPNTDYSAIYYDKSNDKMIFGGNDLLVKVNLNILSVDDIKFPTRLISIISNNRRLVCNKDFYIDNSIARFPSSTLELTFEISDLSYKGTNSVYYEYKFSNNESWVRLATGDNRISFLNLSPGTYTLQIRSGNDDHTMTMYRFRISPPWYMTTFAYMIYIIIAMFAAIFVIKYFFGKNRRKYEQMEKEKSLELSNMKIDFFTNISHELKTPLSLILAPANILLSEVKETRAKGYLEIINKNALRLNSLIQSILDFKRIEYQDENVMIRTKQEMGSLVSSIVSMFSPIGEKRHICLVFERCDKPIWMNVDVVKMESMLYNLISNAVKFVANEYGRVDITLDYDKETHKANITIKDNGEGIPKNEINMIWTRLYQGNNKKKNPNGTGIGLYLVKQFVQLHNGEIHMESEIGEGTTVNIAIPDEGANKIDETTDEERSAADESRSAAEKSRRLLFVDDNEEILSFLTQTFSSTYLCMKANNGEEGLQVARASKPDLIIIDEMMPEMNGLTLCRRLRKEMPTISTPIIMLTAKDDNKTEIESMKAGADIFMAKPFDINRLRLRIEQLLESRLFIKKKVQMERNIENASNVDEELLNDDERLMNEIIKTIEERMSDSAFNVNMLCSELSIGTKRVLRLLKVQTGMTPVNFIRSIRMKKAALLLRQNKFTISEVMYMVGFQNSSYFSKCFSSVFGVNPKEYMEKNDSVEA